MPPGCSSTSTPVGSASWKQPAGRDPVPTDRAMAEIARLKKKAKSGDKRLAVSELG